MPNDRYPSAAQFGKDAAAAVSGMPVQAPADGATVLMSAAPAATVQMQKTRISQRQPTPDTPAPHVSPTVTGAPKKKMPVLAIVAAVVVVGGGGAAVLWSGNKTASPPAQQVGAVTPGTAHPGTPTDTGGPGQKVPDNERKHPGRPSGQKAVNQPQVVTPPQTVPGNSGGSRIDSAAVEARMNDLTDPLLDDKPLLPSATQQLQAIYDSVGMLPTLKGKAARYLMMGAKNGGKATEACLWSGRALQFPMPHSQSQGVDAIRLGLGCQQ
jgi:hypothetical protein